MESRQFPSSFTPPFTLFYLLFETGCHYAAQAVPGLTEIQLLLPLEFGIKVVCHQTQQAPRIH